ncbi:MogA/MoaB family molybdenum cofactor biosynthesis protein [Alicyclobacillus sp. ALC3]|uniref:MogA/MoaB family molybdenum cofactor biosynthesis protein n=1 Tax=Alicyclobacillus sp. ALC3 TaxID=2796143 RepID=UPI002379C1B7|nr:MogA/MoaB family molybdenum cofactor biosynthesis protein [Alicyclobacillus sp. ALC3]WDL98720.1 MogA/MoaB family molybdenum cofactor biosynthesis protein [Alicyclobacillus sp. ALC3]
MAQDTSAQQRVHTAAVITLSDGAHHGTRVDKSGDLLEQKLASAGYEVVVRRVLPDERAELAALLRSLADDHGVRLVVTTGGTGLGPRDVTPDATRDVIDREVPGMAEAMRMESLKKTPFAMTSRQVVGTRGQTLIVNLPGSPKAVDECLDVIIRVIPHTLDLLAGKTEHK